MNTNMVQRFFAQSPATTEERRFFLALCKRLLLVGELREAVWSSYWTRSLVNGSIQALLFAYEWREEDPKEHQVLTLYRAVETSAGQRTCYNSLITSLQDVPWCPPDAFEGIVRSYGFSPFAAPPKGLRQVPEGSTLPRWWTDLVAPSANLQAVLGSINPPSGLSLSGGSAMG